MADPAGQFIRYIAKYPGRILAKTKITPNWITFIGLIANFVVAFMIAKGQLNYLMIGILIWVAGFFDALDGSVARFTGQTSDFGDFWDSVLDRYADSVIYLGIMIYFMEQGKTNYVILIVVAIIGSMLISYTRAKAESLGQNCEVGLLPRTVRIILLGAAFCVGQVFWGLVIIALLTHLTVCQRIFHVYKGFNK